MTVESDSVGQPEVNADVKESAGQKPQPRPKHRYRVHIFDDWCKKCGICVELCPKGVLTRDELGDPHPTNQDNCIGCTQCVLHCPDFAIAVSEEEAEEGGK